MKEFLKIILYHIILFLWILEEFFGIVFDYIKKRFKDEKSKI
jgi:hypothetical protein